MYSKINQKFYLPAPGGKYLFSYDPHSKEENILAAQEVVYRGHPELNQSEWELLSSCTRTEYLVESPFSGERFLVKWCFLYTPLVLFNNKKDCYNIC